MLNRDAIDAVLFDLDGTLMDTDDTTVEAMARRLQRLHCPCPQRAARRLIMASETPVNLLITLADVLGLDAPLTKLSNHLRRARGRRAQTDFRVVAQAEHLLADLSQRYRLAVVTTRRASDAEMFLARYDLRGLFDALVTRESTRRLKPHPAPVHQAAKLLGVPVERCLMVGDTTTDLRAARRAGAKTVGVLCGFGEREELERAGADVILEHTADLSSLL